MENVRQSIQSFLSKNNDGSIAMSELIHMVFIAYYDKKGDGKDVKQLQDHRDQRYTQNDYYMHSSNS